MATTRIPDRPKPRTLTPSEFARTAVARAGGTFEKYLHYLAAHRAATAAPPVVPAHPAAASPVRAAPAAPDPLAAFRPDQNLAQTAAQTVRAQTTPLIAEINAEVDRRARSGAENIRGATSALAAELARYGPAAAAAYSQTQDAQRATNEALANRLGTLGAAEAARLPEQVAGDAARTGTGAANAGYATGSAELSRLIAEQAASQDYGAKLPGIAGLYGAQSGRALTAQLEGERAQQTGDIRAKVPGLTVQTLADLQAREDRKAGTVLDYRTHQQDVARDEARYQQSRADRAAAAKAEAAQAAHNEALKIQKMNADERYRYAALNATNARAVAAIEGTNARSAAGIEATNARAAAGITATNARTAAQIEAQNARTAAQIEAADRRQKTAAAIKAQAAKKTGGLTPGQHATLKKQAAEQADQFYYGIPPKQVRDARTGTFVEVPGTGVPGVNYGVALRRLMSQYSIPRAEAVALLNDYYAPGERGRPAGPPPKPTPDIGFRGADLSGAKKAGKAPAAMLVEPGNINLNNRPVVHNADGTVSTVRSITITDDRGRAVLIPTVVGGRVVSDAAAVANYRKTGQHLGIFANERAANAYAQRLHEQQARRYGGR